MASSNPQAAANKPGTQFPWKPALAVVTAFALLFFWHRLRDQTAGLYPGIFADAFRLQLHHRVPAQLTDKDAAIKTAAGTIKHAAPGARPWISPYLIDDSGALDPFFASLHDLETGKPKIVTILHYGDSPTTADLITGDARAMLQARFGDAGHGFNLIAKPWAWYGHRDVSISDHGWTAATGVGSMRQAIYGLGGARFQGEKDAHSTFKLADAAQTDVNVHYFTEPNGGSFTVSADGVAIETVDTHGDANTPSSHTVHLPQNAKEVTLTANGAVTLLGVDFRKGNRGVVYDSLGLNGASTTVLSRAFEPTIWATELQQAAPSLVIINYGTNESSFGSFVDKQYEGELRTAVARVRKALPSVPILIMSPMDRGERAGLNEIKTMATIPRLVAIQQRVAADLHCAFFDTFDAMGGDGTMSNWYTGKPRLVAADLIHPTPQGALIVAQELIDNFDLGYARWQKLNDIQPTQPAAASRACRPVALPAKKPDVAPPGTVAATAEPLPATGPATASTGTPQMRTLPPCPVALPKAKVKKEAKPAVPTKTPTHMAAPTTKPSVSGDTEKDDASKTYE